MAGIEDLVEVFRGENVKLNPFRKRSSSLMNKKNLWKAGKFITDTASEAASYARKIPSIIKSAKIPRSTWKAATTLFDKTHFVQPRPGDSRYYYGLLNHADRNKLKVDILKTIGVNLKNLSPLAVKGLNVVASLPVATITMVLKSTPANADEATMKLEDFAKLAEEAKPKKEKKEKMAAGGNVLSTDIKDYWRRAWGIGDRVGFQVGGQFGQKFDIRYFIEELDLTESELDKAAKHYTKGKVNKFKNLVGPVNKQLRRDITQNLLRNNKKFIDPAISAKSGIKKAYQEIKIWIDDFQKKNNRLPSKVEIAKGTGYATQGAIEAGEKKGLFKTYKGIPPEAAKAGAEKRAILQTKTAKTATVPILRKSGPGKPVEQVIFPDKKIGNKTYRQAFIDDLKLRYKYPMMSKEAKAAGVLSDAQMMKKYGIPSQKSLGQYIFYTNKFEGITAASPIKSSKEHLKAKQDYRDVLKKQQGKVFIPRGLHGTVESGTHLQHALLKNPKLPITAENLVFIPARMNTKHVRKLENLRNKITAERDLLLKNKPKDWIKRVELLNKQGIEIAAQTDGIVQFEKIDHKGNKYVHKLGSEKYQLDVAGLNKDKLLKDYKKADWDRLRLNVNTARTAGSKLSKLKLNLRDSNKLSSTIQSIMNKKNSGLNIVDIARWGSAELSALDDIAGKLPSKVLSVFGKLLKTVGIAAIPVDAVPFTEAHSKGLGTDVGAMNLAEIYTNLPGTIWEAGEWVASKVQGKEHEWKPFYEATFGREYETKKLQETPLPVLEKRIDRWATDMAPAEEFDKISSYLDRRGIPGITAENMQLQQYEADLLERVRKEKALADQKKKEESLTGVDKYIISNLDV